MFSLSPAVPWATVHFHLEHPSCLVSATPWFFSLFGLYLFHITVEHKSHSQSIFFYILLCSYCASFPLFSYVSILSPTSKIKLGASLLGFLTCFSLFGLYLFHITVEHKSHSQNIFFYILLCSYCASFPLSSYVPILSPTSKIKLGASLLPPGSCLFLVCMYFT